MKNFFNNLRHSYYSILRVLCFLAAILVIVWQMPRAVKFKYEYQKLTTWKHKTLYSPFDFPIYKEEEQLKKDMAAALKNVYPIYVMDMEVTEQGEQLMLHEFDENWYGDESQRNANRDVMADIYESIEYVGILARGDSSDETLQDDIIEVVRNKVGSQQSTEDLYTIKSAMEAVAKKLSDLETEVDKNLLNHIIISSLRQNVIYSEDLTKQAKEQALSNVSLTKGMVHKGDLIIAEGEMVTDGKYLILNSLQKEYDSYVTDNFFSGNYLLYGQLFMVLIVFIILFVVIKILRPDTFEQLSQINLILVLMLMEILPSFIILKLVPDIIYIMPLAVIPMLLITFFDVRVSMVVQILSLLVISLAVPNPFQFFFVQTIVSFVSIFTLLRRSSRSNYFLASLTVFLSYSIAYFGFTIIYDGGFDDLELHTFGIYALNALFTLLTLPLAFLFERVFGCVTDLTLLELSNTNSPLLRKLASEAPGTFQHVMQVADVCEEALYAIGGNMLLARTGALYHDVGKLKNPYYFIENQNGKYNPHDDVSYTESAQIIISHVIDGIELCRKHHIPEQIIDFVRTHHGTRRTEYFYQMELRENPGGVVDEADFRYHGPIPFSKETAVLMMADAVEAASRSLKDKNEQSISKLVDNIIDGQVAANQFVNTEITFRDIATIKKVLKKKLMSVYHVRIAYPD